MQFDMARSHRQDAELESLEGRVGGQRLLDTGRGLTGRGSGRLLPGQPGHHVGNPPAVQLPDEPPEQEARHEAQAESGRDVQEVFDVMGTPCRKPSHVVNLTDVAALWQIRMTPSQAMSQPNSPSRSSWLRWSFIAVLILAGIGLAVALGPGTSPVVEPVSQGPSR